MNANGRFSNDQLLVRYVTTDAAGKVRPVERTTIDLKMRPETFEVTKAQGLRVLSHLALPPGRYQLRVAAGHADSDAGSVVYDLVVPDFFKESLSMSGVLIGSMMAAGTLTIKPTGAGAVAGGPPLALSISRRRRFGTLRRVTFSRS